MNKYIIKSLLLLSMILLVSCGSNSKKDPAKIDHSSSSDNTEGYYFSNTIDEMIVNEPGQYDISFKLNKDKYGLGGQNIQMRSFDSRYGSIEKENITTDENGRGIFVYNAPETMPKPGTIYTISYDYNIELDSNTTQSLVQNVTLKFGLSDVNTTDNIEATNLSISYITTECSTAKGAIIAHYNVHAVNEKSREPSVGINVELSLVNGVRTLNGTKIQKGKGEIIASGPIAFKDTVATFLNNVKVDDNLIILPTSGKADISYLGGWNIDDVSNNLQLSGNYNNILNSNGLTYIIGNEKRLLGGNNGSVGITTSVHIEAVSSVTDSNGFAYFDVIFDSALGGHTVVLEAHGDIEGKRSGISKIEFLRVNDFKAASIILPNINSSFSVAMFPKIIPGCIGDQPLIDVPTGNYEFKPSEHCFIDTANSTFHTDGNGKAMIQVVMDGNVTGTKECTLSWKGGSISVGHEY